MQGFFIIVIELIIDCISCLHKRLRSDLEIKN